MKNIIKLELKKRIVNCDTQIKTFKQAGWESSAACSSAMKNAYQQTLDFIESRENKIKEQNRRYYLHQKIKDKYQYRSNDRIVYVHQCQYADEYVMELQTKFNYQIQYII